jgi:adenosylcobinamide kinase / adenosylcobinamide-phosphate guanylyltransferase
VSRSTLLLGGARSGKSRHALRLAESYEARVMIATAEARDAEMAARIERHRAERDSSWRTMEAPVEIAEAIARVSGDAATNSRSVIVVDCLTLWLSNLMHTGADIAEETDALIDAVAGSRADIILISNELGLGLVPETRLGREFRDAQGCLNQRLAAAVDVVEFLAAGLPLRLKP